MSSKFFLFAFLLSMVFSCSSKRPDQTKTSSSGLSHASKAYLSFNEFTNIKLSPDGKHLLFQSKQKDQVKLSVLTSDKLKPIFSTMLFPNYKVKKMFWANSKRIIVSAKYEDGY